MDKKKITVSIIGCAGVPAQYGGFETLAEQLCIHLSDHINLTVFCSSLVYGRPERINKWKYARRIFLPISANGFSSILYDLICLIKTTKVSTTVLILGGSGGIFLPFIKLFNKKKVYIFHPDGLEWQRNKWNPFIKAFLFISIKIACKYADKIIIDNKALVGHFENYMHKSEFIGYGGDQFLSYNNKQYKPQKKFWLTIARSEPENNLIMIGNAIKQMKNAHWILVTNWKRTRFGRNFFKEYGKYPNISILDSTYDKQIIAGYLNSCEGYIHGHSKGGTNPSLSTALWLNKPILCHDNMYNRETTKNSGYFFKNTDELVNLINQERLMVDPETIIVAKQNYSWKTIAAKYDKLFCSDKMY
jgi:glycosyltransferase involved in cell wall biosynthesis